MPAHGGPCSGRKGGEVEMAPVFVTCPECGHEQSDMGHGVECDNCGYGPMPTAPVESADEGRQTGRGNAMPTERQPAGVSQNVG